MKNYWTKWEWRLWLSDPALSMCEPSTRGIWMDALCAMMESGSDRISGTVSQLSRICRCTETEMARAIADLEKSKTCEIVNQNESKTLICRRLSRALEISRIRASAGHEGGSKPKAKRKQTAKQNESKPLTLTLTSYSSGQNTEGNEDPNKVNFPPTNLPSPTPTEPATDFKMPDPKEVTRWTTEALACFPNTGKPSTIELETVKANVMELLVLEKPRDVWEQICMWIQEAPSKYKRFKPSSPMQLTDPKLFSTWATKVDEAMEQHEYDTRRKR